MISFNSTFIKETYEFKCWKQIDKEVHRLVYGSREWGERGYDGINNLVYNKFRCKVSRDAKHNVVYTFDSEEDYLIFKLMYV